MVALNAMKEIAVAERKKERKLCMKNTEQVKKMESVRRKQTGTVKNRSKERCDEFK